MINYLQNKNIPIRLYRQVCGPSGLVEADGEHVVAAVVLADSELSVAAVKGVVQTVGVLILDELDPNYAVSCALPQKLQLVYCNRCLRRHKCEIIT